MSWDIWRVATDRRIKDSLSEILESWDLETLWEAHDVLNALDQAARDAAPKE